MAAANRVVSQSEWESSMWSWHCSGDPVAEAALAALQRQNLGLKRTAADVRQLAAVGDKDCQRLLSEMEAVPSWVDFNLMRQGGVMVQRQFPLLILALTYGSLPLVFADANASKIFARTGRFSASISRRLNESTTLFLGVTNSDQLAPHGPMWEACMHVRLVHAHVRQAILASMPWDIDHQGMPISQFSTAAGPAFFGTQLLENMQKLGAQFTDTEALGHQMIWRYVTSLLGVPEPLVATTQQEQDCFDHHMMDCFFGPDETSVKMMAELVSGLANSAPTNRIPSDLQLALFHRLLGPTMAKGFAIPVSKSGERKLGWLVRGFRVYAKIQGIELLQQPMWRLGRRALMQQMGEGLMQEQSIPKGCSQTG